MRSSSVRGGITRTRAAASSIASGRPSSSPPAARSRPGRRRSHAGRLAASARCTNSATASAVRQRRQRQHLFAGQPQHLARRDHEARLLGAVEPATQRLLRVARHLLEVVEDHQAPAATGDGMPELGDRIVPAQRHVEPLRHRDARCRRRCAPATDRRTRRRPETRRASSSRSASPAASCRCRRCRAPTPGARRLDAARQLGQRLRAADEASRSAGRLWRMSRSGSHRSPGARRGRPFRRRAAG